MLSAADLRWRPAACCVRTAPFREAHWNLPYCAQVLQDVQVRAPFDHVMQYVRMQHMIGACAGSEGTSCALSSRLVRMARAPMGKAAAMEL